MAEKPVSEPLAELAKKAFGAAIRVISRKQGDVRTSYELQRSIDRIGKLSLIKPMCPMDDLSIACSGGVVKVRLFYPQSGKDGDKLIVFFHGGGWVTGDIDTYNRVCSVMARNTGYKVASVNYRLAPEHKFPKGFQDCYEVARYFYRQGASVFNVNPEKIVLAGDSAGGNLVAAVSLLAREKKEFTPLRQILFYPATYSDHTEASPFPSVQEMGTDYMLTAKRVEEYMELYQSKEEDRKNPYFAPLLAESFEGLPETLVLTANFDPLRDEGEAYAYRLKEAGGKAQVYRMDALHGFLSLPAGIPVVKDSYEHMNAFLQGTQKEGESEYEAQGRTVLEQA